LIVKIIIDGHSAEVHYNFPCQGIAAEAEKLPRATESGS
jgi:hypothetical protein